MRCDQSQQPFVDYVRALRDHHVTTYLSIGHKLGAAASPEIIDLLGRDFFTANNWLNAGLYHERLRAAEDLAADAWGAERSFYLVDGSSSGNRALFLAALRPGDDVIVSRDLHWSMLVALIMTGAVPHYVAPRLHHELDIAVGVAPEDIAATLEAYPETKLVALVSPSFCGVASDLTAIAAIAHAHDVPLFVDEAWGAHFHFHPDLPRSAMACGADAAVASVHKLLPAISQGSVLHVSGERIDRHRLHQTVHMTQTTSPLVPIVASLDSARHQMATDGNAMLSRTIMLARDARRRLAAIPGLEVIDAERLGLSPDRHDLTKLVIDVHGWGCSGFDVERMLNDRFAIAVEMGDHRGILANINTGDRPADIDQLVDAFATLASELWTGHAPIVHGRSSGDAVSPAMQVMTPRDAYFAHAEHVRLEDAVGCVAADLVTPYPPGIPILVPGELITREKVDYLTDLARMGRGAYGTLARDRGMVQVVSGGRRDTIEDLALSSRPI